MFFSKILFLFSKNKNIFLFSHMRSRSSLLSHIIGSSKEVAGYYEMHQHYFSIKSLFKQKFRLVSEENASFKGKKFVFDKILHDAIIFNPEIFKPDDVRYITMIRKPEDTIASLMGMGKRKESSPFTEKSHCEDYYIKRLHRLRDTALHFNSNFLHLESDNLIDNSKNELERITKFLGLSEPLREEYQQMQKTGKAIFGDSSKNIRAGKIVKKTSKEEIEVQERVFAVYEEINSELSRMSV